MTDLSYITTYRKRRGVHQIRHTNALFAVKLKLHIFFVVAVRESFIVVKSWDISRIQLPQQNRDFCIFVGDDIGNSTELQLPAFAAEQRVIPVISISMPNRLFLIPSKFPAMISPPSIEFWAQKKLVPIGSLNRFVRAVEISRII